MDSDTLFIVERLRALFPDQGGGLLADAGFASWDAVLESVPSDWLEVAEGSPEEQGEQLFINIREYLAQRGEWRSAIAMTRGLVRRRAVMLGEEDPDTLAEIGSLGALADRAGRHHDAEEFLSKAYQGLRSVAGGRDLRLANVANHLAWHYLRVGKSEEAEQYLEHALIIRREVAPESVGLLAAQLGELRVRRGDVDAAIPSLWEAWEASRDQFGPADSRSVQRALTLSTILVANQRLVEALPLLRVVYQAAVRVGDPEQRAAAGFQLGCGLEEAGRREEAWRLVDESVRWTREYGGPGELAGRLAALARMAMIRGRPMEAEGMLLEALEADRRVHGDDTSQVASRYASIGLLCRQMGRSREAIGWLEPAVSLLRGTLGDEDDMTCSAVDALVELWLDEGKEAMGRHDHGYARDVLLRAVGPARDVLGKRHWLTLAIEATGLV